jgi:hypothetical protein
MSKHPLVLFYGKGRKLNKKEMEAYKSFPLILFISREPNDVFGELDGAGAYNYDSRGSRNSTWPLAIIAGIIGEDRNKMKSIIQEKGLSPIILSYRYPCSIPNNDNSIKTIIRNISDYSRHSSNIANLLKEYRIGIIIDHSGVDKKRNGLNIPLKNNPPSVLIDTYIGNLKDASYEKLIKEIKNHVDPSAISNIWKEFLSNTGN